VRVTFDWAGAVVGADVAGSVVGAATGAVAAGALVGDGTALPQAVTMTVTKINVMNKFNVFMSFLFFH